jgi:hypothetical protein
VDATCALAAGATCLSDVEAMTAQEEIFGPRGGASDSTMLRALDELAERLGGDGLPRSRYVAVNVSAACVLPRPKVTNRLTKEYAEEGTSYKDDRDLAEKGENHYGQRVTKTK